MRTLFFVFALATLFFLAPSETAFSQGIDSPFSPDYSPPTTSSPEEEAKDDPYAIATDAQIEEAQHFYESCMSNDSMKAQKDCKCAAASFLETRMKLGNAANVDEIMAENINKCLLEGDSSVSNVEDLGLEKVTEKQMEEAMGIYAWCEGQKDVKNQVNCECLAAKFLDFRIKRGPMHHKDTFILEITQKHCRNVVETTGLEFSTCMTGTSFSYAGIRPKDYCECYAKMWGKMFKDYKGRMDEYKKSSIRIKARSYCNRPEAYEKED